uniref:Myb-related transcription factor, partner of profilin-like n=1 Tax=Geotrypetes seraphini TaxID=260995 RepID=A0A6P8QY83_GEOSA|nr:myb-related transcription factor, partner of profilin-like [Geotrypetes seraphini]XP_033792597.1 myb-related transcription factor, partner of profilin-like [Geotrypetes seraphini]XP_033792598.1 myb-related transcription factor, partner of profilin-like [Geotrypetes seraphini]
MESGRSQVSECDGLGGDQEARMSFGDMQMEEMAQWRSMQVKEEEEEEEGEEQWWSVQVKEEDGEGSSQEDEIGGDEQERLRKKRRWVDKQIEEEEDRRGAGSGRTREEGRELQQPIQWTKVANLMRPNAGPPVPRPRIRQLRFTAQENELLLERIIDNYSILFGRDANRRSLATKGKIWKAIASEVSSLGVSPRTVKQCKHRYRDCKRTLKDKVAKINQHQQKNGGGGPCFIRLTHLEECFWAVLGSETVEGLSGDLDTAEATAVEKAGPSKQQEHSGAAQSTVRVHEVSDFTDSSTEEHSEGRETRDADIPPQSQQLNDKERNGSVMASELQWSTAPSPSPLVLPHPSDQSVPPVVLESQPTAPISMVEDQILAGQQRHDSTVRAGMRGLRAEIRQLRWDVRQFHQALGDIRTVLTQVGDQIQSSSDQIAAAIRDLNHILVQGFEALRPQQPLSTPSSESASSTVTLRSSPRQRAPKTRGGRSRRRNLCGDRKLPIDPS